MKEAMTVGLTEEAGRVANSAVTAMHGSPLAIALLVVNIGFLAFCGYILGEVAQAAQERNKGQMELIAKLVSDIRDCRQGSKPTSFQLDYAPSFKLEPESPQ